MGKNQKSTNSNHASSPTSMGNSQAQRHPNYYLNGGDLYILISEVYFRVHSSFFLRATNFFQRFTKEGEKVEPETLPGTGEAVNAILVRNASVKDMETFLWIFYNEKIDDYGEASLDQWFTILRLADDWGFDAVKAMALRYIKKREDEVPDIVERLLRYEECNPPNEVLFPLYMKLCAREEYPTEEECSKLGDSRVIKIHRAREKLLRLAKKTAPAKPDIAQMKQIVVETLQLETFLRLTAGKSSPPLVAKIEKTPASSSTGDALKSPTLLSTASPPTNDGESDGVLPAFGFPNSVWSVVGGSGRK